MIMWLRQLMRWWWRPLDQRGVTLNTLTATNADAIVPELWDPVMNYQADRISLAAKLAGGDGSEAAVIEKTDLTKVPGDLIRFPMLGRLLAAPVSGDSELEGNEEKIPVGSFSVGITYYRHATAVTKTAMKRSQLKPKDINKLLAEWLGRTLDDDWMDQVLNQETVTNVRIFAGNKTSRADLQDGDVITPTQLRKLFFKGVRRGLRPYQQTRFGPMPWPVFGACLSEIDYYVLSGQDDWEQDVRLGASRGEKNPALTGVLDMYKGILLYPFAAVDPGDGFLGSFLRPEARLAADITSSATTITAGPTTAITGVDYWKYFPTSGTNTLRIGSEQISYTATPGNSSLTVVTRGANNTTAAAHTAGDYMTLNNLSKVLLFGQRFLLRGWSQKPSTDPAAVVNITQKRSYGFESGFGVDYEYGLKAVLSNGDSQPRNYAILEASSPNPNNVG